MRSPSKLFLAISTLFLKLFIKLKCCGREMHTAAYSPLFAFFRNILPKNHPAKNVNICVRASSGYIQVISNCNSLG